MKKEITLAICYDFDKTLSPDDMQSQGFIQEMGLDVQEFWEESNQFARDNKMDQNLAWMFKMKDASYGKRVFNKELLKDYGKSIKLFDGVLTWFGRVNAYGQGKGVAVEHYIISSGLKEMIEGTAIASCFKKIYASSFYYDEKGVAIWPAQAINYTDKTQFLFRIEKGVLDVNNLSVNDYFAPETVCIPFRNIVYIGDSDTDVPCMKVVNANGGHSIGVYNPEINNKQKVYKMMRENRIKYFAPANYEENGALENLVKMIIDRTAFNEKLEEFCAENKKECGEYYANLSKEQKAKDDFITELEMSRKFDMTREAVKKVSKSSALRWNDEEIDKLAKIALGNYQVLGTLTDWKNKAAIQFFDDLLQQAKNETDAIKNLREKMSRNAMKNDETDE